MAGILVWYLDILLRDRDTGFIMTVFESQGWGGGCAWVELHCRPWTCPSSSELEVLWYQLHSASAGEGLVTCPEVKNVVKTSLLALHNHWPIDAWPPISH